MNARTTRATRPFARVRPHLRRRNGVVDAPRDLAPRGDYRIAVSVGWRPQG